MQGQNVTDLPRTSFRIYAIVALTILMKFNTEDATRSNKRPFV
jgi:hypothetical protein